MKLVYCFLLAASLVTIDCLIGGTRLLYALPAYGILSIGAVLAIFSFRAKKIQPDLLCLTSTAVLGAWVLLRAHQSPVRYLGWPDYYMMMGCLMAYLLTAFYLSGMRERAILLAAIWLLAAVEIWFGLVQFTKDPHYMPLGIIRPPGASRASGMFISANHFAGFLETVAILTLSMAVWSRWRAWAKILAFYIAGCCWLGVAVSGSRGGYFSVIGSLAAFGIGSLYAIRLADPRKFLLVAVAASAGIALVIGTAVFLMESSDFLAGRIQTMMANDLRIYNWQAAIANFRVSPWIGTGGGTHLIYARLFRPPGLQGTDPIHAHCDYLELLAEYGVVGGLCMALFLFAHLRQGLKGFSGFLRGRLMVSDSNRSDAFAIQLGALCAVAALAVHSVFDFNMHIPGNALLFAFIFGILANPGVERPEHAVDRRVTPWLQLLLPVLGGWMIWSGVRLIPGEWCVEHSRYCLRDGKYPAAIEFANRALGFAPDQPELVDKLVKLCGPASGDPYLFFYKGEANRAIANHMRYWMGRRKYFSDAVAAFQEGLKLFPTDENLLVRMAQSLDGLGEYSEAENYFQKMFRADSTASRLYLAYRGHLMAEGDAGDAKAVADKVDAMEKAASQGAGNSPVDPQ